MKTDIKKLRERIDEIQQLIKDASEANCEHNTSFPQKGNVFYYINSNGFPIMDNWDGTDSDYEKLRFFNVFETLHEAIQHIHSWIELRKKMENETEL